MGKVRKALSSSKKIRLRIVAGSLRGRVMLVPENPEIRPTKDMVREAFFDILSDCVVKTSFLDLFAGTGAVGFEAWSRGSKPVTFVDNGYFQINLIKETAKTFGIEEQIEIVKNEAGRFVAECVNLSRKFDIIYCDPPYDQIPEKLKKTLSGINEILKENGMIIFEHETITDFDQDFLGLTKFKEKKYGGTKLSFYSRPLSGNI